MNFQPDSILVDEHRRWIGRFDLQYGKNWEKLLNDNLEAAACEATVRRLLEENGNVVEPNEELEGKKRSPDFRCTQAGKTFFVEVTCISIQRAIKETSLPHPFKNGGYHGIQDLNDVIFDAAVEKTPQCSNLNYAALVAVGTFHSMVSSLCFQRDLIQDLLTGRISVSHDIEAKTGISIGETYLSTKLRSAAFLKPEKVNGMSHARNPVSGILVCGFGHDPFQARLVLHPRPTQTFDRNCLHKIECCRLKENYEAGQLVPEWI